MNKNSIFEYGIYLSKLIASSINKTAPQPPFEGMDWERLYRLASFHGMTALVHPAVSALDVPAHILSKFQYDLNRMKAREARQEIEAQRVFSALTAQGISFIKMKGIVMKHLYPMPYMRSQVDVDLCMSKEDRERSRPVMESLGYEFDSGIEYHDEYTKDNFFFYELHSQVTSRSSEFYKLFTDPFSKSQTASDGVGMVFTDEYFYLHLVTHMYKHFISEGCGIKFFCDLYVYEQTHPNLDKESISETLAEYGIGEFYENIIRLSHCLFENEPFTEKYADIANFVFKCSGHGNDRIRKLTRAATDNASGLTAKNKFRYFLHNWFPGVQILKNRYPVLEKAPVLLPVCWLRRGFYTLFFKRSALAQQRDEIKKMNSDEIKEARKVRELIGVR